LFLAWREEEERRGRRRGLFFLKKICFVLKFEREVLFVLKFEHVPQYDKRQPVCFMPLDTTNGHDFKI
jgi:hypothetical protein